MTMTKEDIAKYKKLYLQAARDNVKNLQENNALLLAGKETEEVIENMHREAHSLKSESILMGYNNIGQMALTLEHLFKQKQETNESFSSELLTLFETIFHKMETSLEEIEKNDVELAFFEENESLESFAE